MSRLCPAKTSDITSIPACSTHSDLACSVAPLLLFLWALTMKNPGNLADHRFSESEFNYYH